MAKKKSEVQPNAGGYRRCPDCDLSFRYQEMFDQHRNLGCKPTASKGQTWSEKDIEDKPAQA